jgi:O-antigen/teichoic acid export membrane protein
VPSVKADAFIARVRARIESSPMLTRFLQAAAWSLVGIVASRAATIVASIVAARWLDRESFGALGIVQSTLGMFQVVANLGLGLTATKFVAELRESDPARAGRIVGLSQLAALVLGAITALAVAVAARPLAESALAQPRLAHALALSAPLVLFGSIAGTQFGVLAGFGAFRRLAAVHAVSALGTIVFVVSGVVAFGLNGAIKGLIAAVMVQVLAGWIAVRLEAKSQGVHIDHAGGLRETDVIGKFSLPAALASLVATPAVWASQAFLVRQPGGLGDMAVLNAANQWFNVMTVLPLILAQPSVSILAERYASGDRAGARRLIAGVMKLSAVAAGALALICSANSRLIMGLYGADYVSHANVLIVALLAGFLFVVQSPVGNLVAASGRMWLGLAMNVAWGAALLGAAVLFGGHGALGIAAARAIAYLLHLAWSFGAMLVLLRKPV